jgi:predicted DNA-binding WGR domain protein
MVYKDDKSNKFWNIQYNKEGEYRVQYGRIGSKGVIISKKGNIHEIQKIIGNKMKKGYKLESKRNIKKFSF